MKACLSVPTSRTAGIRAPRNTLSCRVNVPLRQGCVCRSSSTEFEDVPLFQGTSADLMGPKSSGTSSAGDSIESALDAVELKSGVWLP